MKVKALLLGFVFMAVFPVAGRCFVCSDYPVVFAHGMAGFDDILGYDYWGDDYGTFVGNVWLNPDLSLWQESYVSSVCPFNSSEVRGLQLANNIESYMASEGTAYVNIIGHSQGGLDARKAAKVLRERKGYAVVKVMCSVSSPHRGSPIAKYILDLGPGVGSIIDALFEMYGDIVYGSGNDTYACLKQLVYNDYDPNDGVVTGMKAFNQKYPVSSSYASRYVSYMTAQDGLSVNPALYILREGFYNIDGDGYCVDDGDNDGAAGRGDGNRSDHDDDGLVGINSQQMGYRLFYESHTFIMNETHTDFDRGYVGDINYPNSAQMTSQASLIDQDHIDVIGVGPDTFDEMQFYASLIDYIDAYD